MISRPQNAYHAVSKIESKLFNMTNDQKQFWNAEIDPDQRRVAIADLEEENMDKLDLIFKNQPKEIQEKLVKLLIRYNASMQYNQNSDMFEVDLMIPFQSEQQKKQFIKQFLQIRRQKPTNKQTTFGSGQYKQRPHEKIEWIGQYKQPRKFSFNNNSNHREANQQDRKSHSFKSRKNSQNDSNAKKEEFEEIDFNISQTGQFAQIIVPEVLPKKEEKLNFDLIDEVIARRLKAAVDTIQSKKRRIEQSVSSFEEANTLLSNEPSKAQSSIIDQVANQISLGSTQKINDSKELNASSREQIYNQEHYAANYYKSMMSKKGYDVAYVSQRAPYVQIAEEPQEEEYEPLFKHEKKEIQHTKGKPQDGKVTAFQDYAKKYASIKNEKSSKFKGKTKSTTDKHVTFNSKNEQKVLETKSHHYQSSKGGHSGNNKIQDKKVPQSEPAVRRDHLKRHQNRSNSKSQNKNRSMQVENSRKKLDKNIEFFLQSYHNSLNRLYTQIRNKIEKNPHHVNSKKSTTPEKSIEDLYILVLDDLSEDEGLQPIPEQVEANFKDQMLKQYHRQILVKNKNLSSEDLIRYFRYLHSNAKKLYLNFLKNKRS